MIVRLNTGTQKQTIMNRDKYIIKLNKYNLCCEGCKPDDDSLELLKANYNNYKYIGFLIKVVIIIIASISYRNLIGNIIKQMVKKWSTLLTVISTSARLNLYIHKQNLNFQTKFMGYLHC